MRNRYVLPIVLTALLCALPACDKSDSGSNPDIVSIVDFMPQQNEISGWNRAAGGDGSWLATNASELQTQINGGSELYTNHGFVEAAMQSYTGTVNAQSGVACEIQVYDQGSAADAVAVFDHPNNVFTNPITPSNPPAEKAQISRELFSYRMKFVKGQYYVLLSILTSEDKGQEVIEVFATNVAGKMP
jgi:hypothetical protein